MCTYKASCLLLNVVYLINVALLWPSVFFIICNQQILLYK
jgi:hypothetical protein